MKWLRVNEDLFYWGPLALAFGCAIGVLVCSCADPNLAQKTALAGAAKTCEQEGSDLIDASASCPSAIASLRLLVQRRPACRAVFPAGELDVACNGLGQQPRRTEQ